MRRRPLFIVEEDDESGASTRRPPRLGRTTRVATRFDSEEGGTIFFCFFLCVNVFAGGGRWGALRSVVHVEVLGWLSFGGD